MSEGGGEALGPPYGSTGDFQTSQPSKPQPTVLESVSDPNFKVSFASGLPPFSSFTATDLVPEGLSTRLGPEGYGTEPYMPGHSRVIDIHSWGYLEEGLQTRLYDRGDGVSMLVPPQQYRPWESKPMETTQDDFTKRYEYPGSPAPKLPSFQSQFNSFPEQNGDTISLTTLTPAPPSPTVNNSGLPSFHTLSAVAVNPRNYPLVPNPVQAREIPHLQSQFLDERSIQLFQAPAALNNAQYHQLGLTPASASGIIQGNFVTHSQPPQQATLLTVVKTEPVAIVTTQLHQEPNIFPNPNSIMEHESVKMEENSSSPRVLQDSRKKERRKPRTSSIETSGESDGVGNSSVESSGQVAAISSTANFKSPLMQHQNLSAMNVSVGSHNGDDECENGTGEKQTKKKRKRCGECIGCQRKDNCGECAPCRNDKSHQICKMRRCEKLTDKKHLLYLQNEFPRTESRRGRGKGTRASYRNKGGRGGGNSNQNQGPPTPQQTPSSGSATPQPAPHPTSGSGILTLNGNDPSPNPNMMTTTDHSPGSVMPFYGSNIPTGSVTDTTHPGFAPGVREHRFPNTVWQAASVPTDATSMGAWPPQGQFIQQLPPPLVDDVRYHTQYPPGAPVTVSSYTQPSPGYQPTQNNFLQTNGPPYQSSQPPAVSPLMNGGNTPRTTSMVNGSIDYVEASPRPAEYLNGAYPGQENSLVPQPPSTPNSRCSSVQNMDSNTNDSSVGVVIAPSKTPTSMNSFIQPAVGTPSQATNQGNVMPGYPPQQPPQSHQSLHNSSGYPGQNTQSAHRFTGEDVKPKLKTMILSKQHASQVQSHFSQNQQAYRTSEDGQFSQHQNKQFCAPTPPPPSPVQVQSHHTMQNSPSNLPSSSQHFQYNSQNCGNQHSMQPSKPSLQGNDTIRQQSYQLQSTQQQQHNSPEQAQQQQNQQQRLHHHQQQQIQQQNQQFQQQFQRLNQQQAQEQQEQQFKHQTQQQMQQPQNALQHQHQQIQQQQEQQQQQINHQFQQQQLQHQQQMEQQNLQQQHMQQQQQQQQMKQNSTSPRSENGSQNYQQTPQPKQFLDTNNFSNKTQIGSNNFLMQGHHPRSLATEGGGFWGHLPAVEKKDCANFSNATTPAQLTSLHSVNTGYASVTDHLYYARDNCSDNLCTTTSQAARMKTEPNDSSLSESPDKNLCTTTSETDGAEIELTEEEKYIRRLTLDLKSTPPECGCPNPGKEGTVAYYSQLGSAANLSDLRKDLESRLGLTGNAIRIEKILYTSTEGKTLEGCPMAKWIIRRSSADEKLLVLVKHRPGHACANAWIVVVMVAWEAVARAESDDMYNMLVDKLNKFGTSTPRKCENNKDKICGCQGLNPDTRGGSFSFGCSWSVYHNTCKFARSDVARKFKLSKVTHISEEKALEQRFDELASAVAQDLRKMAPQAFANMTFFDSSGSDCRIGLGKDRPFCGVTACLDYCAHSHRDLHNMNNGVTCLVTLTKHRDLTKPDSEQLHVLPHYTIDDSDEFGSRENQIKKCETGAIEVLTKYEEEVRVLKEKRKSCRQQSKKVKARKSRGRKPAKRKNASCEDVVQTPPIFGSSSLSDAGLSSHSSPTHSSPSTDGFRSFDYQVQSSLVSSTMDSPTIYQNWKYGQPNNNQGIVNWNNVDGYPNNTHPNQLVANPAHLLSGFGLQRTPPSMSSLTTYSVTPGMNNALTPFRNQLSPYLQYPTVDSFTSPSREFTRPYPLDTTNVKRDLTQELEKIDKLTPIRTPKRTKKSKKNIPTNTPPQTFLPQFEDKGTSVDANFLAQLPPAASRENLELHHWPGIHDIIPSSSTNSSPMTPSSLFLSPPHFNSTTVCSSGQPFVPNEDKAPCYPPSSRCQTPQTYLPQPPSLSVTPGSSDPESLGRVVKVIDNEQCFTNTQMGGVAIALSHGSLMIECAKHELHGSTALRRPNRLQPSRISLVFYQHRFMNWPKHGAQQVQEKRKQKMDEKMELERLAAEQQPALTTLPAAMDVDQNL